MCVSSEVKVQTSIVEDWRRTRYISQGHPMYACGLFVTAVSP
jgi:hypothetical protein